MVASLWVEMPGEPPFEARLDPDLVTVGRAEDNGLSLRDMNVSRHHFSIERRGEFYVIQDQGSRNGTLLNGVAVLNKILVEGDRVQVGGSTLTFRAQASSRALRLDEVPRPTSATPISGFGQSPAPRPGGAPLSTKPYGAPLSASGAAPSPSVAAEPGTRHAGKSRQHDPMTTRWRKLAEVACAINVEHDLEQLLESILDAVLTLVPAKSAFLVLREGERLTVKANRNAAHIEVGAVLDETKASGSDSFRLSRQVCLEAIAKRRPVLTQDAVSDQRLNQFLSVVNLQLKSILCVPFSSQDEVLGVVYLDEPECDPFEDDGEVVELVGAFGEMAGIALANARLMVEIAARERLEQELAVASRIQRSLLPTRPPQVDGLELAGKTMAARSVGGDIYDFFVRDTPVEDLLVSIGDVAGKGVGAGLVMASVRALLHAYAEVYEHTDKLLAHLNEVLSIDLDPGVFVSFLLIRYDPQTGLLRYTGCGHEHLIIYRPSTGQMEFIRAGGVVLGLVERIEARISERSLNLQPGDVVCLYTDGATEARDDTREEFGLERIGDAVKAGPLDPGSIVERVMSSVIEFTGAGRELHDDLTCVVLRKT